MHSHSCLLEWQFTLTESDSFVVALKLTKNIAHYDELTGVMNIGKLVTQT